MKFNSSVYQKRSSPCYHHCGVQTGPPNTQRVPSSQKQATCTTARIKHQSLPRFRFYNLPPVGKSKLVVVCQASSFLSLFTKGPRRKRPGKYGPHWSGGCASGKKATAVVSVCVSTGERHGFGIVAPSSTSASSLEQGKAGGPMEPSPKLVRRIGLVSTCAERLYPLIIRSAAAAPSVRLRVLVYVGTSA